MQRPRDESHGDFASNIALMLAKPAGKNPRELAEKIISNLPENNLIDQTEIAGPGFINFRFKPSIATMTTYRDSNFVTAAFSGKYTLAFRQI